MKSVFRLFCALTLFSLAAAEDYLVSRQPHIQKRGKIPQDHFNISIFHVNDIHAHLDEITTSGTDCVTPSKGCYGGYARIKNQLDTRRKQSKNSLFLDIGDEFQGTLFYGFYGGEKIAETLNQLDVDAMTLGNHEFDRGEEYLGQFLKNLTFPIICANVQSSEKHINHTVKPYKIFRKYKTAIIGVTTDTIPFISSPSDDTVFPDPIATAQYWTNYVYRHEHVERVILMTHIGYEVDIELAKKTKGIHLIVGGHSHTLLGDMDGALGKYPTIETNLDGEEVFIVTAYRYGEYLGYIDVEFDKKGKVVAYTGGPIHLTNQTAQDPELQAEIKAWRAPFEEFASQVIGVSNVVLDRTSCQSKECTIGNLLCDAVVDSVANSGVAACVVNAGGIRASIDQGNVTRGAVLTILPFGNAVTEISVTGETLWKAFEGVASKVNQFNGAVVTSFVQVSGLRMTWNPANPVGTRLINLEIGLNELTKVDFATTYRIAVPDFVAGGGDNIFPKTTDFVVLGTLDEVFAAYIQKVTPVTIELEGRITETTVTTPVQ